MSRRPATFATAVRRGFTNAAVIIGMVTATALAVGACTPDQTPTTPDNLPVRSTPATPPGVDALIVAHDCWTGEAPADMQGEIPGHVVVTVGDDADPTYGGDRLVGKALEQIFDGTDHGLTVHAFCR